MSAKMIPMIVLTLVACARSEPATPTRADSPATRPRLSLPAAPQTGRTRTDEVFYQIFTRSFRDTNGDGHGDLKGVEASLDLLAELGVTCLWLNPIWASQLYHNYFIDDFYGIDPTLGTRDDLLSLARAVRARGMRLLLDMETQYISGHHPWFTDAHNNPASPWGAFIRWNGPGNTNPESIIWNLSEIRSWDGRRVRVMTLALDNPQVLEYQKKLFMHWLDPDGDGDPRDGIDGYRMDHLMDDLDGKKIYTGLLAKFWRPIVEASRTVNPHAYYLVEPADWGNGRELMEKTGMDASFQVQFRHALAPFSKDKFFTELRKMRMAARPGQSQVLLLENHDTDRFASEVRNDPARLRAGAVLLFTTPGAPALYYGQELGMRGKKLGGMDDGNDIPLREAYEWHRRVAGPGMAIWYRGDGPWWKKTNLADEDGVSLEEQRGVSGSLYEHYRRLIVLRRSETALQSGALEEIPHGSPKAVVFTRLPLRPEDRAFLVAANLSKERLDLVLDLSPARLSGALSDILAPAPDGERLPPVTAANQAAYPLSLAPYEARLLATDR